jgi:ABC-2 type transport system ATP-binding protein
MSIKVESLSKIYGTQKAVDNISFEIPAGQVVGFLGPNGAGKSTTMKMLTGFIPPNNGTAYICGINIEEDPLEAKSKIGYLPEHNPLYTDMYIREQLLFMANLNNVSNPTKRVEEIIEITGLTLERKKKIGQISKGFRQRVGLAQALIHNPEVLILDEPTSGLDPNQIEEIRKLILEIGKEKTILLSTHIMQEVELMCERTIIINRGSIVIDDLTSNLGNTLQDETRITVEFSDIVPEKDLKSLPGISSISRENQSNKWHMTTSKPVECKIEINKIAAKHNCYLLEQKEEKLSLEKIFQKLTKNVDHI